MRRAIAWIAGLALAPLAVLALAAAGLIAAGTCGESDRGVGVVAGRARTVPPPGEGRSILFGDLHVHTTFSIDAFLQGLPLFGGEGAHPPADACDFARHCAQLDFFSLNDHAESLWPARWKESIETVRACNARAGDPANPDLVAFAGYEWTQVGATPETHFGHKNVIFRGTSDDEVARRPIDALPDDVNARAQGIGVVSALAEIDALGMYSDFFAMIEELARKQTCPAGVDTRELPDDCRENATTPRALFEKLAQSGLETLVIPHGLAWGEHAPVGARLDPQLENGNHDPERQRLIEVYSGHGNGEEFRAAHAAGVADPRAPLACPAPDDDFLPCCWRAGELMRERCGDLPPDECEARVEEAKRLALEAATSPHRVFPELPPEAWLDCDQCRDCFKPVFNPRAGMTAQYAAAIANPQSGARFRFGFIASSDNHAARAGTGYKQLARHGTTDVRGFPSAAVATLARPFVRGSSREEQRAQPVPNEPQGFRDLFDKERAASFLYPGGLVAVHADARDRDSIWQALRRREVYGTSGPRILLWFDLVNAQDGARAPMGSESARDANAPPPRFVARALGSFVQKPGCAPDAIESLGRERIDALCLGECFHPSDERRAIEAIEVVRIRAASAAGEDVASRIEDPWKRFACAPDPAGCEVEFDDPEFEDDTAYYVRAIEEPSPAINGGGLRARFAPGENGAPRRATSVEPCHAGWPTAWDDDCLSPVRERAWSSPIYVDRAAYLTRR